MEIVSTLAAAVATRIIWRVVVPVCLFLLAALAGAFLLIVSWAAGSYASQDDASTVGLPSVLDGKAVPARYAPLINRAALTCPEVTAPFIAAQLAQESGFNPNAVSPVGAQGIAQFMPDTWQSWGADGDGDGIRDPKNPADAIPAQARYMCHLYSQVKSLPGDHVDLMLAAYNAGLGTVQQHGGVPPYAETQSYVRRIRSSTAKYAKSDTTWVVPTQGRITSVMGARWGRQHNGIDIAAPIGTPVVAATQGVVTAAGPAQGFGQWIKIRSYNSSETIYGHVSRIDVHVGQPVQPGQVIGAVGNEGRSTGPHLHFEIRANGTSVDPIAYYAQHGVVLE